MKILSLLICLFIASTASAQDVTYAEFKRMPKDYQQRVMDSLGNYINCFNAYRKKHDSLTALSKLTLYQSRLAMAKADRFKKDKDTTQARKFESLAFDELGKMPDIMQALQDMAIVPCVEPKINLIESRPAPDFDKIKVDTIKFAPVKLVEGVSWIIQTENNGDWEAAKQAVIFILMAVNGQNIPELLAEVRRARP